MKERDKINNIVNNLNDSSNSEIIYALDYLNVDFEQTKDAIVRMTKHLDTVEVVYDKLLKELENRMMLLGLNGMAYTDIWNETAKELEEKKEKKK